MKYFFSLACLLLGLSQIKAQLSVAHTMHFAQNGFVQNSGQFTDEHGKVDNQVQFLYIKDDFHLALKESGFSYELIQETQQVADFPESGINDPDDLEDWKNIQPIQESVCRIDIRLKGANPHPSIIEEQSTGTVYNYYLGRNSILKVPSFNRIIYKDIYSGIDLIFEDHESLKGAGPEYSFIVHPGADIHQIKMLYTGAGNVQLEDQHTLSIAAPIGFIKETGLRGYCPEDGSSSNVSFSLKNGTLSFNTEGDKNKTLIIDPSIVWGTYYGGQNSEDFDTEAEIALDNNSNVFLTGSTTSKSYISTTGAVMSKYGGARDMMLAKFNPDGTQLLWATFFGGSGQDVSYGLCFDSQFNVLITGFTKSANVMTTSGVFQTTLLGFSDVLIAKFSNSGLLIWSTLMGGSDDLFNEAENGRGVMCDAHDNVFVTGYSTSTTNIATTGAYQTTYRKNGDAYLVKFNKDGQKIWGTYFSGTGKDRAHSLCFDPFGHIYILGTAKSKNFISGGFQTTFGGNVDVFLAKFDTAGSYYWSSYYGGSAQDHGRGIRCDGAGNVYFGGWTGTATTNIISTPGSYQQTYVGGVDGFIAKFNPQGGRIWGTYFGGIGMEEFFGMEIDNKANLYICGSTNSSSGIASIDAVQQTYGGATDAMILSFDSSGHRIWSTYFGGNGTDNSYDLKRDTSGNIYLVTDTYGPLPVSQNAFQTIIHGNDDLSIFKFNYAPCSDANETNDSFQHPYLITDTISLAGTNISAAISGPHDQDWFKIHLRSIDTSVTITLSNLRVNYDLKVTDPNNQIIASSANAGTANETVTLHHDTGYVFINILHDTLNFTKFSCYSLQIARTSTLKLDDEISALPDQHLKIYPNPSPGLIQAEIESDQAQNISITVFDAIGRKVFSEEEHATQGINTYSLNLSPLNEGLYFMEVKGNNMRNVTKLSIEK